MAFIPQTNDGKKNEFLQHYHQFSFTFSGDYLPGIIWLPKFYYKYRILQWFSHFSLCFALTFVTLVIYNSIYNTENVIEQDILIAAIILEVCIQKTSNHNDFT